MIIDISSAHLCFMRCSQVEAYPEEQWTHKGKRDTVQDRFAVIPKAM